MNKKLLENYFEENGFWHMKDKDGKCKPFLMKDLEELLENAWFNISEDAKNEGRKNEIYQKGFIAGADTTGNQAIEIMAEEVENAKKQERERIIETILTFLTNK